MPLVCSADFDTVIAGLDYRVSGKLTVNLPGGPYTDFTRALSSVSLTATMTSPLPEEARTQGGIEAVSADFTIAGSVDPSGDETITAADLFNPDNPDSPLYHLDIRGCSVFWEQGVYVPGSATPETPRVLTGWITSADIDWNNQTVTLHVIDLDPDWDDTPQIPAVVTAAPFNAGLTNEFPMDALVRQMKGDSTNPAVRPECVLSVGMRSSLWPEVGTIDTRFPPFPPTFAPGVNGTGFAGSLNDGVTTPVPYVLKSPVGTHLFIEFRGQTTALTNIEVGDYGIGGPGFTYENVTVSSTQISFYDSSGSTLDTVTWAHTSQYTGIAITLPSPGTTAWSATWFADSGATHSTGGRNLSAPRVGLWPNATVTQFAGTVEGFQVTTEASPASNDAFTPIAVLDPSYNPLTVVPAIAAKTKSWDEMQTMAASECGFVRRDGNGIIRFSNRVTLLGQAPSDAITSYTQLKDIGTSIPPTNAQRKVNVTYTEWDYGDPGLVWSLAAKAKKKLLGGQVTTWTQEITDGTLVAQVDGTASILGNSDNPGDGGNSFYLISLDRNGVNRHPGLASLTIRQLTATTFEITADNRGRPSGFLVVPSSYGGPQTVGDPSLWIGGIQVTAGDAAIVSCTYGDGKNPLDFGDNPYIQDHDTAVRLGNYVLAQVAFSIRDYPTLETVPDPRIVCGDIKPLKEPKVAKVAEYIQVWGYTFTADFPPPGQSGGTWTQTLDPRAMGPPDAWLGGAIPDRAEVTSSWAYA